MKLDRNRAYGTISGVLDGCANARFTQDNIIFDVDGNLANAEEAKKAVALLNERAENAKTAAAKAVADAEEMAAQADGDVKRLKREAAILNGEDPEDDDDDLPESKPLKTVADYTGALELLDVEIPEGAKLKDLKVLYAQAQED